jgi:hypothetical protein
VRKMEMDAYSSFLKLAAVTGMSWVSVAPKS